MDEIYISTDIETDGPVPGQNSMLSFASAAFLSNKQLIATFSANLETLPNATTNPITMNWWKTEPQAWQACRQNLQSPGSAILEYVKWLKGFSGKLIFIGYPLAFDFSFVYWYLMQFAKENPFGFNTIDIKSYAMATLKRTYKQTVKHAFPKNWFDPNLPHTHIALDDAIEQGILFCNILTENLAEPTR